MLPFVTAGIRFSFENQGKEEIEERVQEESRKGNKMSPTGSLLWHCDFCGKVNDAGQQTCAFCGRFRESSSASGQPSAHRTRPGGSRRLFLICLSVSVAVILSAGGLVLAYFSYTPFRTVRTFAMSNSIRSLAWSPDSRAFAAVTWGENYGSGIAMVNVWRTSDGQRLLTYTFPSPPQGSSLLAWAPDGRSFALAWNDGSVEIWEAKEGNDSLGWSQNSSFRLSGYPSRGTYLTGLAWSAAGKRLLVSYSDGQLHIWDALDGHLLPTQVAARRSSILALSPDGAQAVGQQVGATYAVWEVGTGKAMALPSQNVIQVDPQTQFAWAPDGHSLAATYGIHVIIWQWNPQRKNWAFVRSVAVVPFERGILALAWAPDNQRFAVADSSNVIRLWSVKSGKLLGPQFPPFFDHPASKNEVYSDTENAITTLAWSPNGKYLLSGNYPGRVLLQEVY